VKKMHDENMVTQKEPKELATAFVELKRAQWFSGKSENDQRYLDLLNSPAGKDLVPMIALYIRQRKSKWKQQKQKAMKAALDEALKVSTPATENPAPWLLAFASSLQKELGPRKYERSLLKRANCFHQRRRERVVFKIH
jgi:hypothetical protein